MDVDVRPALTAVAAVLFAVLVVLLLGTAGVVSLPTALPLVNEECPPPDAGSAALTTPANGSNASPSGITAARITASARTAASTSTTSAATSATTTAAASTTPADGYARTTVVAYDDNGTRLGTVRVRIAETFQQKYTGLSDTATLAEDEGMLFPYAREDHHTYVMRGMDFGIDIVYVGSEGYVTRVHHAPEPPAGADGEDYRYPGCGQYVLEIPYNWTVRHDLDVGDRLYVEGYEEWRRTNATASGGERGPCTTASTPNDREAPPTSLPENGRRVFLSE